MLLIVGRIARPHGLRGEVVVEVRTDEPAQRFAPGTVFITDPGVRASSGPASEASGSGPASVPSGPASEASGSGPAYAASGRVPAGAWQVPEKLTVESARPHLNRMIVTFDGLYDRNLAEALRGVVLWVDSADLPRSDDPDEFSDFELVGLTAVDTAGEPLGEVLRIDHAPASDLLVLRRPDGRTALVPFVRAIVPEVDLAGGRVVLTPPEGLFDL